MTSNQLQPVVVRSRGHRRSGNGITIPLSVSLTGGLMNDAALKETQEAQMRAMSGVSLAFLLAIEALIEASGTDRAAFRQSLERLAGDQLAAHEDGVAREAARGIVAALLGKDPMAYLRAN